MTIQLIAHYSRTIFLFIALFTFGVLFILPVLASAGVTDGGCFYILAERGQQLILQKTLFFGSEVLLFLSLFDDICGLLILLGLFILTSTVSVDVTLRRCSFFLSFWEIIVSICSYNTDELTFLFDSDVEKSDRIEIADEFKKHTARIIDAESVKYARRCMGVGDIAVVVCGTADHNSVTTFDIARFEQCMMDMYGVKTPAKRCYGLADRMDRCFKLGSACTAGDTAACEILDKLGPTFCS